jgi:hypothetical protein
MFVSAAHGVSCKSKKSLRDGEKGEGERERDFPLFPTSAISLILWSVLLSENGLSIALESHIVPLTL